MALESLIRFLYINFSKNLISSTSYTSNRLPASHIMSEGSLVNRYRQYKAGTTRVVDWLAQTARRSRDVTSILPSLRSANNAAKHAKKNKSPAGQETKVKVTTSQLLSLARVIADAGLHVPDEILGTLYTVIGAREESASWYMSIHCHSNNEVAEQNDSHQYFINVLREIAKILDKTRKTGQTFKHAPSHSSLKPGFPDAKNKGLSNAFALLEIDQPSPNALGSAPTTAGKKSPSVTFEMEADEDSTNFALWCFLQDCRDLRNEIAEMWVDYNEGRISLNAAGMATENSISLLEYAEAEFRTECPDLCSHHRIFMRVGLEIVMAHEGTFVCPESDNWGLVSKRSRRHGDEIVSLVYPRAFVTLAKLMDIMTSTRSGQTISWYNGNGPYFQSNSFDCYLESLLPSLTRLAKNPSFESVPYGLLHVVLCDIAFGNCPSLRTWHVFAMQISIDIFYLVGRNSADKTSLIRQRLEHDQRLFKCYNEAIEGDPELKLTDPSYAAVLEQRKTEESILLRLSRDPLVIAEQCGKAATRTSEEVKDAELPSYEGFPAMSGFLIHLSASFAHQLGQGRCNSGAVVLSAAYLYRAVLQAGIIKQEWMDMEYVIASQSTGTPFVREPLDGLSSMYKCFGSALGIKPSAFRKGPTPNAPHTSWFAEHGRLLHTNAPFFTTRYKHNRQMPGSRPSDDVMAVRTALQSLARLRKDTAKSQRLQDILEQYDRTRKLTAAQLTYSFKEVLVKDDFDLKFDYFDFSSACYSIIDAAKLFCDHLSYTAKDGRRGASLQPHEVVYSILLDASESKRNGASLQGSAVFRAGQLVDRFITERGTSYSDSAQKQIGNSTNCTNTADGPRGHSVHWTDKPDNVRILDIVGLPSTLAMNTGQFCVSRKEAQLRDQVLPALISWTSKQEPETAAPLRALMKSILKSNRDQMGAGDRREITALLARLIDDKNAATQMKAMFAQIGLDLESIYDFMMDAGESIA